MIASQLAHMLMVLTDTLMMARLSPEALAGGGLGAATYSFVSIFCIGVIAAVGTLVAIRQGAGDILGATRLTQAGLWLAWLMALVAGLLLWNLKPVLLLFGQTEMQRPVGGSVSDLSAVRPARLPELHGLARLHQRHRPGDASDGDQPGRHRWPTSCSTTP